MGRKKQGFNWKARQNVKTVIDKSEQNKIKVELSESGTYDESNALALPSKKRQTKVKKEVQSVQRILSKTQRKKLEKIVAKKKKKENRNELLEKLSQVQVSDSELSRFTTLSAIQTKGLKRRWDEDKVVENVLPVENASQTINAIKGSKRKLRLLALSNDLPSKLRKMDPNVVGFEESSSESEVDEPDNNESKPDEDDRCEDKDAIEVTVKEESAPVVLSDDENPPMKTTVEVNACEKTVIKKEKEEPKLPVKREPAVFVSVDRSKEIQDARLRLPILGVEQEIMEAINENPVVVIAGETGSGKTTQVPQFLYEAGYTRNGKMIGVTEPRRVAAISMSQRVGYELGMASDRISYLIRFEGNVTPQTEIKFMTDGVLLKEIQSDFVLSKYSVIILDEAHERSVYTDILVGLLSRIVPLRAKRGDPLKLIIMSATLRVSDFTENKVLFKAPPPVMKDVLLKFTYQL